MCKLWKSLASVNLAEPPVQISSCFFTALMVKLSSMKPSHAEALGLSLRLILCYLIFCIAGTVLFSAVYMSYKLCTTLVAGQSLKAFSFALFLEGVRILLPMVLGFSSLCMAFYLTRHQTNTVLPVITMVVLSLVTWYVILPPLLSLTESKVSDRVVEKGEVLLSSGFFREQDDAVFYYSEVSSEGDARGLLYDTTPDRQAVYTFSNVTTISDSSEFTDPLIGETVAMPPLLRQVLTWYKGLLAGAYRARSGGYLTWAFYASIGIALCSVLGFCKLSSWRLLNMNAILYATVAVLVCNSLFVMGHVFDSASRSVASWFSKFPFIQNPLQVLVNLAFALFMLILGIIFRAKNKKRQKLLNQSEEEAFA